MGRLFRKKKVFQIQKRPFILMEVLIAMMLIIIALSPLLAPHIQLAQTQNRLVQEIEYHHFANLLFSDVYEKLHANKISLDLIKSGEIVEVDPKSVPGWSKEVYGYRPQYSFAVKRQKGDHQASAYLITLYVLLVPQNTTAQKISYEYGIFLYRIGGAVKVDA